MTGSDWDGAYLDAEPDDTPVDPHLVERIEADSAHLVDP